MEIGVFIASSLLGIIVGALFSVLFFQTDSVWKRILLPTVVISGTIALPGAGVILRIIETNNSIITFSIVFYLFFIILSFIITFKYLLTSLKNQQAFDFPIGPIDIFLGYAKLRDLYYKYRENEILSLITVIEEQKNENEEKALQLSEREKQVQFAHETLSQQIKKNGFYLELPIEHKIPLTKDFVTNLNVFIDKFVVYSNFISTFTHEQIKDYRKYKEDTGAGNRQEIDNSELYYLRGFLLGISSYMVIHLFDIHTARVHFRYLDKNGMFQRFVTSLDKTGTLSQAHPLTPIDSRQLNLITRSGEVKKSLIKSLNIDTAYNTKGTWTDFLTITFDQFMSDDVAQPIMSMGISIKNDDYIKTLYYLNYFKIENHIQALLDQFNIDINIRTAISQIG